MVRVRSRTNLGFRGMTARTLVITTSALVAGVCIGVAPARAQGRLYDRVDVNIPYVVTRGDTTLQPGDYTIGELQSNKERVLLIYSDGGVKGEATVMTIPAYDHRTQDLAWHCAGNGTDSRLP